MVKILLHNIYFENAKCGIRQESFWLKQMGEALSVLLDSECEEKNIGNDKGGK